MKTISENPLIYHASRRDIARHKCVGCGVNVIKIGDYCMINPDIWERKLHLEWHDNMCIACIEARLGRKLKPLFFGDFIGCPAVDGFPRSDVLNDRLFGNMITLKSGEMVARKSQRGKAELKRLAMKKKGASKTEGSLYFNLSLSSAFPDRHRTATTIWRRRKRGPLR